MKPWYTSWTIWAAILTGVAAALNYLQQQVTDPQTLSLIGMALAFVMWMLRLKTDKGIGGGKTNGNGYSVLALLVLASSTVGAEAQNKTGFKFVAQPSTEKLIPSLSHEVFGVNTNWTGMLPYRIGVDGLLGWSEPNVAFGYDIHAAWALTRAPDVSNFNVDFLLGVAWIGPIEELGFDTLRQRLGLSIGIRIF